MTADKRLQRDVTAFVDPATELDITQGSHGIRLQFMRNGSQHDYFVTTDDGVVIARHAKNKKFASVRSLLASKDFADIRGFATTQARMYREFNIEVLIPPEGEINYSHFSLQTLQRILIPRPAQETTTSMKLDVLLLDGPAGVGKTSLIERFLVSRARRQIQDSNSPPPILHVRSRGRRLTGLDDALAQSIQLVRAQFTFDQVPVLIRHNLIQIAIDGFDELVDPEGYKDAWFAIRDFFDSTEYGGPIILAGRDTFFDEQSFTKQMQESKYKFNVTHVRLSPVRTSTARSWLAKRGWTDKDLDDPYANLVFRPGSYALRPYFLNELARAKGWQALEARNLTPRAFLVDNFVMREATLIGDQLSVDVSDVKQRLFNVFEEIALEMADTETDAVDLSFLQLVTEVAFGGLLDGKSLAKLQHKAGSFALLESDAREGFRRFPHTEISHHFLATALIRVVTAGTPGRFLRRGAVSSDLLSIFAEVFLSQPEKIATAFVSRLEKILAEETTFDRLPDNTASLLITCLCRVTGDAPRHYHDLQLSDGVLFGLVAPANLERIRIQRLDAREAALTQVQFVECEVINLTVDPTTRFGSSLPTVHRIHLITEDGSIRGMFDPNEIATWIAEHSVQEKPGISENREAIRLFERVCRIMLRQHMIKDHEDDEFGRMLHYRYWNEIENILTAAGFMDRVERKSMSGARAPFVRMRDPYRLLAKRTDPKVAAVWAKIGSITG